MFKPPSPYYIYFRSKSNLAYFTFEDGWNSFWGHHTVCVCVCVCVRACLYVRCVHVPQFKVFNYLTEKKNWV